MRLADEILWQKERKADLKRHKSRPSFSDGYCASVRTLSLLKTFAVFCNKSWTTVNRGCGPHNVVFYFCLQQHSEFRKLRFEVTLRLRRRVGISQSTHYFIHLKQIFKRAFSYQNEP